MSNLISSIEASCTAYCNVLNEAEEFLVLNNVTIPDKEILDKTVGAFWGMCSDINAIVNSNQGVDFSEAKDKLRSIIGPWIYRSEPFYRSYFKPFIAYTIHQNFAESGLVIGAFFAAMKMK